MTKNCLWGKKVFLFQCLFLLAIANANAQVGTNNFKYLNPKPLGSVFFQVSFFDNNTGLAAANSSTIARTTDAGATWTYGVLKFTTPAGNIDRPTFNDVHFVTATTAYAVGDGGMMFKSVDAGVNWTQVNNPLYGNARNINAVFFLNKDTGYIGGQAHKTTGLVAADSTNPNASPKLYFTKNGGATWDSIAAPFGTLSAAGMYASPTNAQAWVKLHATGKEIFRIKFSKNGIGYILGGNMGTYPQAYPGSTGNTFAGSLCGLLWKFDNGALTDYSPSKEKFGFSGVNTNAPSATTTLNQPGVASNLYKAMNVIHDSMVVVASWNNNYVLRIKTGKNDSTGIQFVNVSGTAPAVTYSSTGIVTYAKGKYEILQGSYPAQTYPAISSPYTTTLVNTNSVSIVKGADGKLYIPATGGKVGVSADTAKTWTMQQAIATTVFGAAAAGQLYAGDVTPNGTLHIMGNKGLLGKSISNGTSWTTTYNTTATSTSAINVMQFADCDNGIAVGGFGLMLATTDGGKTWTDKSIASFAASTSIYGVSYPDPARLYFTASNGNVYFSNDKGTSNNVILVPGVASTSYGIATWGTGSTTRIWVGAVRSSLPDNRLVVYRSLNNGITWDTIKGAPFVPGTGAASTPYLKFVSQDVGYMSCSKGRVYKTTNGGTTWTDISPTTSITGSINSQMGVFDENNIWYATLDFTANPNQPRFVWKSTNGGASWSANIYPAMIGNEPIAANISSFIFHDANNVVLTGAGDRLIITNDGGSTWKTDHSPATGGFAAGEFLPKVVPAGTPMVNRKLIVAATGSGGSAGQYLFEYGNPQNIDIQSTETIVNTCPNVSTGSVTVNATGGIAPYTYSIDGGTFQTSNIFNNLSLGAHTIAIKESACGRIFTKTVNVGLLAGPAISAGPDQTIVVGDEAQLSGSANAAVSIAWTPNATLTGANTLTPRAKPAVTTPYTLTVVNSDGCTSTDVVVVNVIPYCIKVMNGFTPNGDGINDKWLVTDGNSCTKQISVAVHNRYGNVVYKNDNYQNDWNGTYNGKPVADGTYYYVITYITITGNKVFAKGDVTILR